MNTDRIARALNLRRSGEGQYSGACPSCRYRDGFTVTERRDGLPMLYCHGGRCTFAEMATALHRLGLWPYDPDDDF